MTRAAYLSSSRYSRARLVVVWCAVGAICALGAEGALAAMALPAARTLMPQRFPTPSQDDVTEYERGLKPARALLSGVPVAGFATDVPNHHLMAVGYAEPTRRYFLASYTLAPTRLARVGTHRWMFVDFKTEQAMKEFAARANYAVRWSDGGRAVLEALP